MRTKVLYITCANKNNLSGGSICAERNLNSIREIVGNDKVSTYIMKPYSGRRNFKSKLSRIFDIFKLYGGGLTSYYKNEITNIIEKTEYTHIFIDSSAIGVLAKIIRRKKAGVIIYTFFHNVEYDYMISTTLKSRDFKHLYWIASARYNETCACKYSTHVITLNEKDKNRIVSLYGAKQISTIPITLKDKCNINLETANRKIKRTLKGLFVGSYFPGNTKGLKWFCKEVLPFVDMHLTIVGSGMEKIMKDISANNKLTIIGKVETLTPYYLDADVIILPIISGGGMKVKTAEALMWGKNIIGTPEALEGYNLNEDIAITCKNANDFIATIKEFSQKECMTYNIKARNLFKEKFSYESSLKSYKKLLNNE